MAFIRKGFEYVKLHYRAVRAVIRLLGLGVPLNLKEGGAEEALTEIAGGLGAPSEPENIFSMACYQPEYQNLAKKATPEQILSVIDEAIQIWEERERFLESVKDDTVVDYRWVKMCDAPRKGGEAHPFARVLEKLKKARRGYEHLMKRGLKVRSEGFSSS